MARGRPTLRSPELLEGIIAHLRTGATITAACARERLHIKTFQHWLRRDKELYARVLEAVAEGLRT